MSNNIPPLMLEAFLETDYRVNENAGFILKVGQISEALLRAHERRGVLCSAFITACNPFSQSVGESENVARQSALAAELIRLGLAYSEGEGEHPTNGWEGEASFLVYGLSREAAMTLGRQFEQNAIVWSGADGDPELILLR